MIQPLSLTIAGETVILAPFKLGQLRQAAPLIETLQAKSNELARRAEADGQVALGDEAPPPPSLDDMLDLTETTLAILAISTARADPKMTKDYLVDNVGLDELPAMRVALTQLLRASGLAKGEALAPVAVDAPGALPTA